MSGEEKMAEELPKGKIIVERPVRKRITLIQRFPDERNFKQGEWDQHALGIVTPSGNLIVHPFGPMDESRSKNDFLIDKFLHHFHNFKAQNFHIRIDQEN